MEEWTKWLTVACGGGLGSLCRYVVSGWAANRFGAHFPYGTLWVNIVGCFMIGVFMTLATERLILNPYWRLAISVGFLGGLTTFSTFSYETWSLLLHGDLYSASSNILLNLLIGLAATWLGISFVRVF